MHQVFLGIGGNTGNKRLNFDKVYVCIEKELGEIVTQSSVYETPPWGFSAKENFWNQVLLVKSNSKPEELISKIEKIEQLFGRKSNTSQYTSREMDIDILYFDELVMESEKLSIPHPRIPQRLFVLVPLAEIAPDFQHPKLKTTNMQLLENCCDESEIKKIQH